MGEVKKYLDLPYNYIIHPMNDESGFYYCAKVLEFDGCQSTGNTEKEAYENLKDAMKGWIEAKLEEGFEVPLPINKNEKTISKMLEESEKQYENGQIYKAREVFDELRKKYDY